MDCGLARFLRGEQSPDNRIPLCFLPDPQSLSDYQADQRSKVLRLDLVLHSRKSCCFNWDHLPLDTFDNDYTKRHFCCDLFERSNIFINVLTGQRSTNPTLSAEILHRISVLTTLRNASFRQFFNTVILF